MTLSAEKSFWMTLGCSIDESDREAIQLPCGYSGSVKYTESFKYLGVELTSDLADTADIDAMLSRGRSTFTSLSKVFCSSVKLRVKLFQALIVPTVLHGCECWTLSRAVCDKLNVFQSRYLRTILGVKWQDHVSNETVRL